jgi:2-phosphosulfolactate phosphatase
MEIRTYSPGDDAARIEGFTIVVDVLRAFSVAYYIDAAKPDKYLVVDSVEAAFALRKELPNALLIGERGGVKIDGFDYGNSPTEILGRDFRGKAIVHTTTAGTKGLVAQKRENEVVVGSFVNAGALIRHVRAQGLERVNIYCTAPKGEVNGEEDYAFAGYLENMLLGRPVDFPAVVERLKTGTGKGFREGGFAPETDFIHCMELDRFDVILRRVAKPVLAGALRLERIGPTVV